MIVLWDFVDSAWVLSITKNLEIMGILTMTKIAQDFMVSMEFLEIIGNHNCFTNTFRIKQRLGLTKLDFPFFEIPLQNSNKSFCMIQEELEVMEAKAREESQV